MAASKDRLLPAPDLPLTLAYGLLGRRGDLDARLLHELVGRPKRYSELKVVLEGRRDHNLTVALKRLQLQGLLDRRTDARREPVVHTYELSALGIQVVLAMQAIRPVHESLELYSRARKSRR